MYTIISENRYSKYVLLISVLSLTILFTVCVITFIDANRSGNWMGFCLMVVVLLVSVLCCLTYMPRSVSLTDEALIIQLLLTKRVLPREDIVKVTSIDRKTIRHSVRLFGAGGVFGMMGQYNCKGLGSYSRYTTSLEDLVLVETVKGKKYLINCCQEIVNQFNKKVV